MNVDPHSYKDGLREGVAFLLVDASDRVLLECRPDGRGTFTDVFYPSGSIEIKDHGDPNVDYREAALRREVCEEFRGGVSVGKLSYLGDVKVPEIGLVFYIYWVAAWSGDPGQHTYEEGSPFGQLKWFPLDEVKNLSGFDSTSRITQMLRSAMAAARGNAN